VVRSKFAKSFTTFSICSYVLGIGDRHLDNFLLDQTNGSLIGIDFGCAFGQGVLLQVPELTPFRYTRQFQGLFSPLDSESLIKQDMCYTLNALRQNKDALLTVMGVFIKEPHLDWVNDARTQARRFHMSGKNRLDADSKSQDDVSWYPRKKISIARRKLNGVHPAIIMESELRDSVTLSRKPQALKSCIKLVKGLPKSIRSKNKWRPCATIEEQIDCLVDHAMDPNLLGRTWAGWLSYA